MMLLQHINIQQQQQDVKCGFFSRKRRKIDSLHHRRVDAGSDCPSHPTRIRTNMKLWLFVFVAYTAFIQCLCKCEIERSDVTECLFLKADFNGDSRISKEELNKGVKIHLSYMVRLFLSQIGGFDDFFDDCDHNGDGLLSKDEELPKSCLSDCFTRELILEHLGCKASMEQVPQQSNNLFDEGLYCGRKTFNFWLTRYTVVVTAKVVKQTVFDFRLNGDIHMSWCKNNAIVYEKENKITLRPSACMSDLLNKYSLHVPVVNYKSSSEFQLQVKALAGFANVNVDFRKCSPSEAKFNIGNYATNRKYNQPTPVPSEL
jgi:hypothetical protein